MSKTVVKVSSVGGPNNLFTLALHSPLLNIPNVPAQSSFSDRLLQKMEQLLEQMKRSPLPSNVVKELGENLFCELKQHRKVKHALESMLDTHSQGVISSLYILFEDMTDSLEEWHWEALYDPDRNYFLALEGHWPIGRIVKAGNSQSYFFEPPLKMTVILSAVGIEAKPEWDALYSVVQSARLPIKLQVFVCEERLKTHIDELCNNEPSLRDILHTMDVKYLSTREKLVDEINKFQPLIIHFFCHGSTDHGNMLHLSNPADYDAGEKRISFALEPKDFIGPTGFSLCNVWLITLNCCRGAASTDKNSLGRSPNTDSLARSLVVKGIPAVVGMRDIIDSRDANLFCQSFYRSLFNELTQHIVPGDVLVEIDWARGFSEVRSQLCDRYINIYDKYNVDRLRTERATTLREWILPILYVSSDNFQFRGPSTNDDLNSDTKEKKQVTLRELQDYLKFIAATSKIPLAVHEQLHREIAKLKTELYPI